MVKSIVSMQNGTMEKSEMIKMTAGIVIGIAADMVVSALIKEHLPFARGWRKGMLRLGVMIISMKIGEDCENYFNKVWDETKSALDEAKTEIEQAVPETETKEEVE